MPDSPYRLPRNALPRRYELTLEPDLSACTFEGSTRIELDVVEEGASITLNAIELEIRSVRITPAGGEAATATVALDEEEQQATFTFPAPLQPGAHVLEIEFGGILNDKLHGFYRSTYKDDAGVERVIATTQMEATDARRAFPCWDEPDLKAVFAVTLVVDEGLTALSNGALVSDEPDGSGKRRVRFADTMPMSTYLVAFVVGPLEVTDPVDVDGVPLRVACVPGKRHLADFALEVGAHSLRFFSDYFDIPYPADKLDLVALPDFAAGAMENLGCVTFRENALLVDPASASKTDLERVADVVAHEIAHMWFGDLVTMKWWNGIWLNEAFATFMEMLCVDAFRPDWDRWVTFGKSRAAAMIIDGLAATRTIEYPVGRPEDADGMFDVLTYEKGAAVLRMLEQYLGAEPFRDGVRSYLRAHMHGNTETGDLWDAIEAATGQPARSTMDSWIFQEGYPVVSVESDGTRLSLGQQRFRYLADPADPTEWHVPVMIRSGGAGGAVTRTRTLLEGRAGVVDLEGGRPEYVVVNDGGSGFYRVTYEPEMLRALTSDLTGRLSPLERLHLVNDSWAATVAGLSPLEQFLHLAELPETEDEPNVWWTVADALGWLTRLTSAEDARRYLDWSTGVLGRAFARLGWDVPEGASEQAGQLRAYLATALGTWGEDPEVRAEAARRWDAGDLHPDLEPAAVTILARSGGAERWEQLAARWRQPSTPQEEVRCLYALGEFTEPELVQRTLGLLLTEVRTQNAPFVLAVMFGNPYADEAAWSWFEANVDECKERWPGNTIPRAVHDYYNAKMANGITAFAPELAARARAFLESRPDLAAGTKAIAQGIERQAVNLAFREREAPALAAFLG